MAVKLLQRLMPVRAASSLRERDLLAVTPRRTLAYLEPGSVNPMVVLASTNEDTVAIDLASGALLRLRIPWWEGMETPFRAFDVLDVPGDLLAQPEDLAQPEALALPAPPRQVGTLRSRRVRAAMQALQVPQSGPLLGFRGLAAPYWEFAAEAPSAALVVPSRGPQLIRRSADGAPWIRFGWERDDVWLPLDDPSSGRALQAARRDVLAGKELATALGFRPHYLLVALSRPIDGHCYKVCRAVLPRA